MKRILLLLTLLITGRGAYCQTGTTTLTGEFSQLHDQDTVRLIVYKYGEFPYGISELSKSYNAVVTNKQFKLDIPIMGNRSYECRIVIPRMRITPNMIIIERGDRLHINGTDVTINDFTGKGAEKTNILREMNTSWNSLTSEATAASRKLTTYAGLNLIVQNSQKALILCREYLRKHGAHLSPSARNLLRSYAQNPIWSIYYPLYNSKYGSEQRDSVQRVLKNVWLPFRNKYFMALDEQTVLNDRCYPQNLIMDYLLKQVMEKQNFNAMDNDSDLRQKYEYFKNHYKSLVREKIVTRLILSASVSNEIAFCYNDAVKYIGNRDFKNTLDAHCQCLPGSPAYNFSLLDSNKIVHHLKQYKGKVLVLDFWFTGCGNCRELAPKLKLVEEQFKNDNRVQFISISSDKQIELWKNSIRSGSYTTSPDEINLYTAGRGLNDPLIKKTNFTFAPTLRIIDANGNWCANPVDCRFDDGKDLIAKIQMALKN